MKQRKLIFIHKGAFRKSLLEQGKPAPAYLEECVSVKEKHLTGVDSSGYPVAPGLYYQLAGYDTRSGFHESLFIEIPDTSADEMQQENHESIIYQR